MKKYLFLLLPITLFFSSCDTFIGEEIARMPLTKTGFDENLNFYEMSMDLKKGDKITVWSEMDVEYEGEERFLVKLQMLKDDETLGIIDFDPTEKDMTVGEAKTTIMGKTSWSFSGRNKKLKIDEDGKYSFRAILFTSNPKLKINKSELVVRK